MGPVQLLRKLAIHMAAATDVEDIGRGLLSVARGCGFQHVLVLDTTKLFSRIGPALVFASAGRIALETYDRERPILSNPLLRHAQNAREPFTIRSVRAAYPGTDDQWWQKLPPHLRHCDGIVVPVHDDRRLVWYASFAGRKPDLRQGTKMKLAGATHVAHERYLELINNAKGDSPLSKRELQCLTLLASGKRDEDVALLLGIAPRTVKFHVDSAKKKLGVATRVQAVVASVVGASPA